MLVYISCFLFWHLFNSLIWIIFPQRVFEFNVHIFDIFQPIHVRHSHCLRDSLNEWARIVICLNALSIPLWLFGWFFSNTLCLYGTNGPCGHLLMVAMVALCRHTKVFGLMIGAIKLKYMLNFCNLLINVISS